MDLWGNAVCRLDDLFYLIMTKNVGVEVWPNDRCHPCFWHMGILPLSA
jgi:hypothetical protein